MSSVMLGGLGMLVVVTTIVLIEAPVLGAALVFAPFVYQAIIGPIPGIDVGPVTIFIQDIIFISLFLVTTARILLKGQIKSPILLWIFYGALGAFGFVRGVSDFGLLAAGVSYRQYFYAFVCVMYFVSFPATELRLQRYANVLIAVAVIMSITALWRWAVLAFDPTAFGLSEREGAFTTIRVLNVRETFIILEGGLIAFFMWTQGGRRGYVHMLALLFIPIFLILSHRTLWLVFAVAILLLKPSSGKKSDALMPVVSLVFVGVLVFSVSTGVGSDVLGLTFSSAISEATAGRDSTLLWRYQGWEALITSQVSPSPGFLLFGNGVGGGYSRLLGDVEVTASPHNFYLQNFIVLGIPGVLIWTLFYIVCLKNLRKFRYIPLRSNFNHGVLFILLVSQMVYSVPYSIEYEQYILLGIAARIAFFHDYRTALFDDEDLTPKDARV